MKYGYAQCKLFLFNTLNKVKNQVYGMPYGMSTIHYFKRMIHKEIWSKMPKIIDDGLMHSVGFSFFCEMGLTFFPEFSVLNEFKYMMTSAVFLISAYHKYEETKKDTNDQAETIIQKANEIVMVSEEIFSKDTELLKKGGYAFDDDAHTMTIRTPCNANENGHSEKPQRDERIRLHDKKEINAYVHTVYDVLIKSLNVTSLSIFYLKFPHLIKDAILFFSSIMVILSSYENDESSFQQIKKRNILRDKMMIVKNHVDYLQKKFGTEEEVNQLLRYAESVTDHTITINLLDHEELFQDSDIVRYFETPPMQFISSLLKGGGMASGIATLVRFFLKETFPIQYLIYLVYAFKRAHDFYQKEASLIHFRHDLMQFYPELIDIQNKKLLPAKAILSAQTEFLALEDTDCVIKIFEPESSHVSIDIPNDFDELLDAHESSIPSVKENGTMLFFRNVASAKKETRPTNLALDF